MNPAELARSLLRMLAGMMFVLAGPCGVIVGYRLTDGAPIWSLGGFVIMAFGLNLIVRTSVIVGRHLGEVLS